jgi:hypothetical protein
MKPGPATSIFFIHGSSGNLDMIRSAIFLGESSYSLERDFDILLA